jgi:hypothetical protein
MVKSLVALLILIGGSFGCGDRRPITGPDDPPSDGFTVTGLSPTSGPDDSVNELSITGTGFEAGTNVSVGGPATDVRVISSTLIKAMTPLHAPGQVDLIVTKPGGRTERIAGAYTFVGFTLTSVTPARGLAGDVLRINGTGFSANIVLSFGGTDARVIQPTGTQILTLAPSLPPGVVEVSVTNPNGQRRVLPQGFRFDAVSISASPAIVKVGGGLSVTWGAPAGRPGGDWVGLYRVGSPNDDSYLWWQYTGAVAQATVAVPVPGQPGDYEFRYFADDGYVDAARSGVVTVIPAGAGPQADGLSSTAAPPSPAFPLKRPGPGRGRWCAMNRCG